MARERHAGVIAGRHRTGTRCEIVHKEGTGRWVAYPHTFGASLIYLIALALAALIQLLPHDADRG